MSLKKKPKEDDHEALAGEESVIEDGQNYVLVPPDGGWGWLVLLGSTLVNMLIPGTLKSFGVLFVEYTFAFHASETVASWIPATCYFLYCSLGPVSSYLSSIYSYRTVTLIGGTLASLGLMLCSFANSVTFLIFSYGVLFGCGAGLAFPPGIFIVTSYFVKYRGFANGVAISGSCLGSMFLPPFLGYLIDNYGYKNVPLILGALTLNVWVGALLYHPVERHMVKRRVDECVCLTDDDNDDDDDDGSDEGSDDDGRDSDDDDGGGGSTIGTAAIYGTEADAVSTVSAAATMGPYAVQAADEQHETVSLLAHNLNGYVIVNELNASSVKIPTDDRYLLTGPGIKVIASVDGGTANGASTKLAFSSCSLLRTGGGVGGGGRGGDGGVGGGGRGGDGGGRCARHRQLAPTDGRSGGCNHGASLSSLRYVSTPFHGSTLVSLYEDSQPKQQHQHQHQHQAKLGKSGVDALPADGPSATRRRKTTVTGALQLLSDPLFIVILVSNATTAVGYTNSAILLPMYAISVGHDKTSAQYLLSVVAVLDLVGRLGGSTLSDWIRLDKRYYYLSGLVLSGVALFVLPWFADYYPSMCCACAAFGLGSGVVVGITAVIMVDMLGEERLSSSYGISLFCNGFMQLIGPPVAGYMFESTCSYKYVFHGMGIILLFGASAWLLTPCLNKNHRRHRH